MVTGAIDATPAKEEDTSHLNVTKTEEPEDEVIHLQKKMIDEDTDIIIGKY